VTRRTIGGLLAAMLASGCARAPLRVNDLPTINSAAALAHIVRLTSDAFQGRAPGSAGEILTVDYLVQQFRAAGLEPGNPDGSFVQRVPLVGLTPSDFAPLTVRGGGRTSAFAMHDEVVAFSSRVADRVALTGSQLVFAGYGVQAPEYGWDDFGDLDVKGKTLIVLVNDPPVTDDAGEPDASMFGGRAMTYYGRWTYKFAKAAELGAAGVFVVHERGAAGYGFTVVQGFEGERFDLVTADGNGNQPAVEGWLSHAAAARLLALAGRDYETLKMAAARPGFRAFPLGLTASMAFSQATRTVESQNVIARLPGRVPGRADESVAFVAHWDHLGVTTGDAGPVVYRGAKDNASGVAALIEIARAMTRIEPAPSRSILFLAVTAEEQGLLGSEYYVRHPLYPLDRTLAVINLDANLAMWGRTRDVMVIGMGASELDDYLETAATEQGRFLGPDLEPESGVYYRSDHFSFARAGVPSLLTSDGIHYLGRAEDYGRARQSAYLTEDYHTPTDVVKSGWDLSGFAEDCRLLMAVAYRVAEANRYPEWSADHEFRATRDAQLANRSSGN